MTRKKKSRKPTTGTVGISKADFKQANEKDKKPKKKTGKVAGNRQQEALKANKQTNTQKAKRDPRIGSKKPIDLGIATKTTNKPQPKAKPAANQKAAGIAAIKILDQEMPISVRLDEIEQDQQLLAIVAKQDNDEPLTEQEVDYYNQLMDEHEKLSAELEQQTDDTQESSEVDDDALWDKLDNNDFSDY